MSAIDVRPVVNTLIRRLPPAERKALLARCQTVDLTFGTILCEAHGPLRHVHFPLTAFLSLVASVDERPPIEMGMIGSEGALGATMLLGVTSMPLRCIVQGAGQSLRLTPSALRKALEESPMLRRTLNRYLYVLMVQLSRTAACLHFHEIGQRLARWLLMTHDRAHGDHFHLTHQFLSEMLGVRRSGVTTAASVMQANGLIEYSRGDIHILDRQGLEAVSCECYRGVNEEYSRLLR